MASPRKDLLRFEEATDYIGPTQVTEYLQMILDFLNRNSTELCFPKISSYTESFLVRLVTEKKNLKSDALNFEIKQLATEIINVLEMNRDVFRWTHSYECGRLNKNLLVYKKIYSNKLIMKPAENKLPTSTLANRLATPQSQVPTSTKTELLNMTLRFIKNDAETTLIYPEMPLTQAQYIYSIIKNPKSDLHVGFGYKALCAPLFEALDVYGLVFDISFVETNNCDTASLKLEKKLRSDFKETKNSSRDGSLNSSSSSTKKKTKKKGKKIRPSLKNDFIVTTLKRLLNFTEDPRMASVTFQQLSDEELDFIKGLKTLAASPAKYGSLEAKFGDALRLLNKNIVEAMKTCRLRIEEGVNKSNHKTLTVKKVPKEPLPATSQTSERTLTVKKVPKKTLPTTSQTSQRSSSVPRNKVVSSVTSRDRSLSKERRIEFKRASKLNATIDNSPTTTESKTEQPTTTDKVERAKADGLDPRKTKLLEDMSVPVESDIGMRMMLLMGWSGGALGARGDGILEPIVPSIELPQGAGLGHVPPPKAEKARPLCDVRPIILDNLLHLLQHDAINKEVQFKTPLSKKHKQFISNLVKNVNKRTMVSLGVPAETDTLRHIMQAMIADVQIVIGVKVENDKKIILMKSHNPSQKNISKMVVRLNQKDKLDPPIYADLNAKTTSEVITEDDVSYIIDAVIPAINTTCKTAAAIKSRATRILLLMRFIDMVNSDDDQREFRLVVKLSKNPTAFLTDVINCVNAKTRSSYITSEEMCFFEELVESSKGWLLHLVPNYSTQFTLTKKSCSPKYHNRFYNSSWPHQADNNNDTTTNNQNQTKDSCTKNNNIDFTVDLDDETLTVVVSEEERKVKLEKVNAKVETQCDIGDKDKGSDKIDVKIETVDKLSDGLCVCASNVDLSELDKDIEDLEAAIFEADLDVQVKEDSYATPNSKRSRSNSTNSLETSVKRSKISSKDCLIISPNDPERKITPENIRAIQTRISEEIGKCTHFLPLLKCHGAQKEGLIYSCHDEKDVDWLKKIITDVDLDLKVSKSADDFCIEQKGRKMVIKINSFIPLDSKQVFKRFETFNNGLQTTCWKVLAEQTYSSYVLFIVEIDENSYKYISKENFSLYVGIDKAQFSVIF